jgi:hypothetical protein
MLPNLLPVCQVYEGSIIFELFFMGCFYADSRTLGMHDVNYHALRFVDYFHHFRRRYREKPVDCLDRRHGDFDIYFSVS